MDSLSWRLCRGHPQGMGREKGDAYDAGRAIVQEFGFTAHIRAREEEAQALTQAA